MSNERPEYNQVWLGTHDTADDEGYLPIIGTINVLSTATFAPKNTIGDYTKDSEDYISSLIMSDLSGGMNIEDMNEGSDTARSWTAFADTRRPGKIALNTKVEAKAWSGATGTAYPLGVINSTFYGIIGAEIAGYNEATAAFYTDEAITLTPVGKATSYAGEIFVPCGAAGYMNVVESATGNPTVTNITASLVGFPATYDPAIPATNNPEAVAFWVFDQRLWALTTDGALAHSFTGDSLSWTWPYDEARAWYPRIQAGEDPQRIHGFYNADGKPALFIVTDRGAYVYNWAIPSIENTPVQFPPHPDFGGAVCVWRAGEDLHIGNGLDTVRYTSANVVVPLSGLARDDGVPQELRGRIVDLEPETSEMYALVAPSASDESAFAFSATVGSAGTGNGQFDDVRGIAVDPGGNVVACDANNERVQRFLSSLVFSDVVIAGGAGSGNGQFAANNGPYDVAIESDGEIQVVDRGNSRVQKFNAVGVYLSQFGSFDDGTPAVAASETWTLQNTFGSTGTGNNNFDTPLQVAVDASGNTYTADSVNKRVVIRNSAGVFQSAITGFSDDIVGVALDGSGNIYVTREGVLIKIALSNPTVDVWAVNVVINNARHICTDGTHVYLTTGSNIHKRRCSDGAHVAIIGSSGAGNGQFADPYGICMSETNNSFYVVDRGNSRVQRIGTGGTYISQFAIPASCRGVACDSAGRVYVADFANDLVKRYASTGLLIDSFSQADPDGTAVHTDGTVWVTNATSDNLTEWENVVVTPVAAAPPANGAFNLPTSIAIKQSSGRIYVLDHGNQRVQYFTSAGVYEGTIGANTHNTTTGAMVASSADGSFNFTGTTGGIAVNQNSGDVYVVDRGNDRIQQFSATGTFIRQWGSSGTGEGQFQDASAIAVRPVTGNVFVTDLTGDRVQEFTGSGTFVRQFGSSGTGNGQFATASGLAFSADGQTLYVSDSGNEDIQSFVETAANVTNTYPWLAAWTGVGWYGKWKGATTGVTPTHAMVTSTPSAYRLWWGADDGFLYTTKLRRYFHNPRQGLLAGIDEYEEEGEIITPKFDAAMLGNRKLASHLIVFMENATADEHITIEYRVDTDGGWTLLGTVDTEDKTYLPFNVDAVTGRSRGQSFNWIQFRIKLFRGSDDTQTPIIKSIVFAYTKIPQNSDAASFVVAFPTEAHNGLTAHAIRKRLTALVTSEEMLFLRFPTWYEEDGTETDGDPDDYTEWRGYLTAISGTDSPSNLPDGQRAVNFIRLRAGE